MRRSFRQAYNFAYRLTGDAAEAEDLVQETFLRAYRFFHRFDESLSFPSWLYRIMTNVYIDTVRRKNRIKTTHLERASADGSQAWELPDDRADPEQRLLEHHFDGPLQKALESMSPGFRIAVLLADVEGLAYEEIAEVMQTSIGTVRSRIHRGRRQLRELLKRQDPERYREVEP